MSSSRSIGELAQVRVAGTPPWLEHGPRGIHAHVLRPIVQSLDRIEAHRVLDLGCGDGWFGHALDRCGFDVTGLDCDEVALSVARTNYPHMRFLRGDAALALEASLGQRFDAVVLIDVLDHVPSPRRLLQAAMGALRPGGVLVLSVPYYGYAKNLALALLGRFDARWDPLQEQGRLKFFSRGTLTRLLQPLALTELRFETVGRIPPLARAIVMTGTKAD